MEESQPPTQHLPFSARRRAELSAFVDDARLFGRPMRELGTEERLLAVAFFAKLREKDQERHEGHKKFLRDQIVYHRQRADEYRWMMCVMFVVSLIAAGIAVAAYALKS